MAEREVPDWLMRLTYRMFEQKPPKEEPQIPRRDLFVSNGTRALLYVPCGETHAVASIVGIPTLSVSCTQPVGHTDEGERHRAIIETSTAKYTIEWE